MKQSVSFLAWALCVPLSALILQSCVKKEDPNAATVEALTKSDFKEGSPILTETQAPVKTAADLSSQMYTEGCKTAGSPTPVLRLHPNLVAGQGFTYEEILSTNTWVMTTKYDLFMPTLPKEGAELNFTGTLESLAMSGLTGSGTANNSKDITQKCVVLDAASAVEKCYPVVIPYSEAVIAEKARVLSNADSCQLLPVEGKTPISTWTTGTSTLENGQTINVFIHRTQTEFEQTCVPNHPSNTVIRTDTVATSNDIISGHYSHCGCELVYSKSILRDSQSGALNWIKIKHLILGPVKP